MNPFERFPPGSLGAVYHGCKCPIIDNAHGAGCGRVDSDGNALFWTVEDCPLHGEKPRLAFFASEGVPAPDDAPAEKEKRDA